MSLGEGEVSTRWGGRQGGVVGRTRSVLGWSRAGGRLGWGRGLGARSAR